jgi:flagellar hook-associated protein 2
VSTPVTFSGFNNIDFNLVLTSIMQQASQPLTALQSRQSALQSQVTTYDTLASRVAALQASASSLGTIGNLSVMKGTSSDDSAVTVSAGTTAAAGQFDVVVTELARAQVTVSSSSSPDPDTTVVANGGTITIGGVAVSLAGDATLQQLADAINATSGITVSASVIKTGATSYKLALTSTLSGVANAFTIANALTGGSGVTFTDTDFDGTSGDSAADNAVSATDAALLVNNVAVTGSTNVFDNVITGVTLTARKKDPAATIQVTIEPDDEALKAKVESFVKAYNDLTAFVDDQRAASVRGDARSIGREPVLRQLHNSLRTELIGAHGSGAYTRLAEIGVTFNRTGQLELDATAFAAAVAQDGASVKTLFAGTGGVFPAVDLLLDEYAQADGFIPTSQSRIEQQIDAMDAQIVAMQARLALQRESLQRQFIEADLAMSRLRDQSGALSALGGGFGAF